MSVLTHSPAPASDRQLEYLKSLGAQRSWDTLDGDVYERIFDVMTGSGKFISKAEASRAIDALLRCPTEPEVDVETGEILVPVTEEGMYRHDGQIYRVQRAKTTGNLYAKHLDVRDNGDGTHTGVFTYAGGMIRQLSATERLTEDQARELGRLWSFCIVCAAELTDPTSIARGIGPVCAGRV